MVSLSECGQVNGAVLLHSVSSIGFNERSGACLELLRIKLGHCPRLRIYWEASSLFSLGEALRLVRELVWSWRLSLIGQTTRQQLGCVTNPIALKSAAHNVSLTLNCEDFKSVVNLVQVTWSLPWTRTSNNLPTNRTLTQPRVTWRGTFWEFKEFLVSIWVCEIEYVNILM